MPNAFKFSQSDRKRSVPFCLCVSCQNLQTQEIITVQQQKLPHAEKGNCIRFVFNWAKKKSKIPMKNAFHPEFSFLFRKLLAKYTENVMISNFLGFLVAETKNRIPVQWFIRTRQTNWLIIWNENE